MVLGENDPQLRDRVQRLLSLLAELVKARSTPVRQVDRHESITWLEDLNDSVFVDSTGSSGDVVVRSRRVFLTPAPTPSLDVLAALQGSALDSSTPPTLDPEATDLVDEFDVWMAEWRRWAVVDRERRPAHDLYVALESSLRELEARPESLELVVASGLLTLPSSIAGEPIRVHMLTQHATVEQDDRTGDLLVRLSEDASPRLEDTELLTGLPIFDPSGTRRQREEVSQRLTSPLASDASVFLKEWTERSITTRVEVDDAGAQSGSTLFAAPALILRKRGAFALMAYYERMIAAAGEEDASVPLGLAQLVSAFEPDERVEWLDRIGGIDSASLSEDPLFPLPANREQSEIIDKLGRDSGVVVEGPPGTGKTHTIANLMSALLARGQRVLVTSEKAQALRVLRDKLPPEMQDLCVSVTDAGRGGSNELNRSVAEIASRKADFSRKQSRARIDDLIGRRDGAMARRAVLTDDVRALRESESTVHPEVAHGYSGTAAEIVRRVVAEGATNDWLPAPVIGEAPPLSVAQLHSLAALASRSTPERVKRLNQTIPDLTAVLPSPREIENLCAAAMFRPVTEPGGSRGLVELLSNASSDSLSGVREQCERLQAAVDDVFELHPSIRNAADGVMIGELTYLWEKTASVSQLVDVARAADHEVGVRHVESQNTSRQATDAYQALAAVMESGQTWRAGLQRMFKSPEQAAVEGLGEHATVDGVKATNAQQTRIVAAHLRALDAVASVRAILADVGVEVPTAGSRSFQVNQIRGTADAVQRVDTLVHSAQSLTSHLRSLNPAAPKIGNLAQARAVAASARSIANASAAERATETLNAAADLVAQRCASDAAPECKDLVVALRSADFGRIVDAIESLTAVRTQIDEEAILVRLTGELESCAPGFASALRADPDDVEWRDRSENVASAWAWRRARAWVDEQHQPDLDARLDSDLDAVEAEIATLTSKLAAERAWRSCLNRINATQVQALHSYRDHVTSIGKGSGRHAERFRASARGAMQAAQGAVPAWVMPLQQVLASIPPEPNSFDVVIVDEASQADITSLFLLWLAPRVIVVGDDKQCAPSEVASGAFDPIFDKLDAYLPDVEPYLRNSFTPRSSMFSLLRSRFGNLVRLREHFRCMPEIIDWSSSQFYGDAPLVPLRQFGSDRLPPLRTTFVDKAESVGTGARLANEVEASAIVETIERCLGDSAYDGKSFGVVVLQGQQQVDVIQNLLLERLTAEQWGERRLRVGTPPDFQGDERHVVFLSMVVGPEQQIRALTTNADQRRFNVAASRAQDQLWLFHSRPADSLRATDLRHSLLTYMQSTSPAPAEPMPLGVESTERHPEFDSIFEQRVFLEIAEHGFHVNQHVEINNRRIDLVVTGGAGRFAVECDGAKPNASRERIYSDIERERELKRCGWRFWRLRESEFDLDPSGALDGLWAQLHRRGISTGPVDAAGVVGVSDIWKPVDLPVTDTVAEVPVPRSVADAAPVAPELHAPSPTFTADQLRSKVLAAVKTGPVTTTALAREWDADPLVIRRILASLVDDGLVERQGLARGTRYVAASVADSDIVDQPAPMRSVQPAPSALWETMSRGALAGLPPRLSRRMLDEVQHGPISTLELQSKLGVAEPELHAVASELIASHRIVHALVGGRRVYAPADFVLEDERDSSDVQGSGASARGLPAASFESALTVLVVASEIAPLDVARARILTRLSEETVLRLLYQLEASGKLERAGGSAGRTWVNGGRR